MNESAFRNANEQLERGAQELVGADHADAVPFLCECPDPECRKTVLVTLGEYEQVRRVSGARGIAVLGHEDPEIERVVERNDRFVVTEKFGEAGDVHDETDPRR